MGTRINPFEGKLILINLIQKIKMLIFKGGNWRVLLHYLYTFIFSFLLFTTSSSPNPQSFHFSLSFCATFITLPSKVQNNDFSSDASNQSQVPSTDNLQGPILINNHTHVPESPIKKEKVAIWASQFKGLKVLEMRSLDNINQKEY